VIKHQQLAHQVGAFGAIAFESLTDLKIINTFLVTAPLHPTLEWLPLGRCTYTNKLTMPFILKVRHKSFVTFIQIMFRTPASKSNSTLAPEFAPTKVRLRE
jgi:hypothetical protein